MRIAPAPISVFGAGRVGLVTAACFADLGHAVVCIDRDAARVEGLRRAELPFDEPGLPALVASHVDSGRLRFTVDRDDAVAHGRFLFIAVGKPGTADGAANLDEVLAITADIGERILRDVLVVAKSTVPVGTADRVRDVIAAAITRRRLHDLHFDVVSNPDFLTEGSAVADCLSPDRIVVGATSARALAAMRELYAPLLRHPQQWLPMRLRSAELTKVACDAMLAARQSLMSEFTLLAERCDADIDEVRGGIAADPRLGAA